MGLYPPVFPHFSRRGNWGSEDEVTCPRRCDHWWCVPCVRSVAYETQCSHAVRAVGAPEMSGMTGGHSTTHRLCQAVELKV